MPRVLITRSIPEEGIKMLREAGIEVDVRNKKDPIEEDELAQLLETKEYDALIPLLTDRIGEETLASASSLKIISNFAVGFNNIDIESAAKLGIVVANTPGASTESVAEHTIALMLTLSRRLLEADAFIRAGKFKGWDPMIFWGRDLSEATLGIIGAGRIGARTAEIATRGFGMKVVYHDIVRSKELEKKDGAVFLDSHDDVFKQADFVSIHVPLLPETRHLADSKRIGMMKKDACLINTSRGPVVDEKALVEALREKRIRGAALDVFEDEPEMAPSLVELPNVILTPHIASATAAARVDMSKTAAGNIIEFFRTGKCKNAVNKVVKAERILNVEARI